MKNIFYFELIFEVWDFPCYSLRLLGISESDAHSIDWPWVELEVVLSVSVNFHRVIERLECFELENFRISECLPTTRVCRDCEWKCSQCCCPTTSPSLPTSSGRNSSRWSLIHYGSPFTHSEMQWAASATSRSSASRRWTASCRRTPKCRQCLALTVRCSTRPSKSSIRSKQSEFHQLNHFVEISLFR